MGSRGPVNFHLLMPPKMISPSWLVRKEEERAKGGVRTKVISVTTQSEAEYGRLYQFLRDHQIEGAWVVDGIRVSVAKPHNA
jgi:hypothetical protein